MLDFELKGEGIIIIVTEPPKCDQKAGDLAQEFMLTWRIVLFDLLLDKTTVDKLGSAIPLAEKWRPASPPPRASQI